MGWWSTTIMGGDSPLDFEDGIYEICNTQKWGEGNGKTIIEIKTLIDNLPKIVSYIEDEEERWYREIGYQVLGVIMMESGCPIPDELKFRIIQAAENDQWAKDNKERKSRCLEFAKAIEGYKGTPTEIESESLLESFRKFKAEGGTGLINKIPLI